MDVIKSLVCVMFCIQSCVPQPKALDSEEEHYVEAYKKSVLFGCLNQATDSNLTKLLSDNNDLGLYSEVAILVSFNL